MKIRVLIPFRNIETNKMTKPGDILEISDKRFKEMEKNQADLNGNRTEPIIYFEVVDPVIEVAKKEPKTEKAVKKTTKKAK